MNQPQSNQVKLTGEQALLMLDSQMDGLKGSYKQFILAILEENKKLAEQVDELKKNQPKKKK